LGKGENGKIDESGVYICKEGSSHHPHPVLRVFHSDGNRKSTGDLAVGLKVYNDMSTLGRGTKKKTDQAATPSSFPSNIPLTVQRGKGPRVGFCSKRFSEKGDEKKPKEKPLVGRVAAILTST